METDKQRDRETGKQADKRIARGSQRQTDADLDVDKQSYHRGIASSTL